MKWVSLSRFARVRSSLRPIENPIVFEPLESREVLDGIPFWGLPAVISPVEPTTLQAEEYDHGGQGVAYQDVDPSTGIVFRPGDRVDFSADGAEGVAITSTAAGEWTEYTVDVPRHGHYDVTARVSSSAAVGQLSGLFHLEFPSHGGDAERTGLFLVPGTGANSAWVDITLKDVHLHEGQQRLRWVVDQGGFQLDRLLIAPSAAHHVGDAGKLNEHDALLDLVPPGSATHTAVRSGNWSNPSTWAFGLVPTSGADVWIPSNVDVNYDVANTTPIRTIRVDGTFNFAPFVTTRLHVDTLIVSDTGKYVQGTAALPIAANVTSTVVFTDTGPIDRTWDPEELSRGLVSHGEVSIYGAAKTAYSAVSINPIAGAMNLPFTTAPTGWRVGDQLVVTGATSLDPYAPFLPPRVEADGGFQPQISTQDEVVTITAINGHSVTIDRPLTYSHVPPAGLTDAMGNPVKIYVANLTRNVVYRSATPSDNVSNAAIHRQGHVMFMHSDRVAVSFAQFSDLGRTNKAIPTDDLQMHLQSTGVWTTGTGTNVRGRYALHFHRSGVNGSDAPIVVNGVSVTGGPGWGVVNHQSYVVVEDSVAYDVPGAAFVEEDGTGIGAFRRNLAIRMTGTGRTQKISEDGDMRDQGFSGHGFFFRGNAVDVVDNVVAGAANAAYVWSNDGDKRRAVNDLSIPTSAIRDTEIGMGIDNIDWWNVNTKVFRGNVAFASSVAVESAFWMSVKGHPNDARHEIRDYTGWNLFGDTGIRAAYTRNLTMVNVKLHHDSTNTGIYGVRADTQVVGDHVYDNVHVTGYTYGLATAPTWFGFVQRFYVLSNSNFTTGNSMPFSDPRNVIVLNIGSLVLGRLDFVGVAEAVRPEGALNVGLYISGTKTDSIGAEYFGGLGSTTYRFFLKGDQLREIMVHGYYTDPNQSTYLMIPVLITDRVTLATKVIYFRSAFDPSEHPNSVIGPNLGAFVSGAGKPLVQINPGSPTTAGSWLSDRFFSGGTPSGIITIPDRNVRNAAPESVYRFGREGNSVYTLTGFIPYSIYTVRLHFNDYLSTRTGERIFDVRINGETVLKNLDVKAAAGAAHSAIVRDIQARSDGSGRIVVEMVFGPIGVPIINGIEVLTATGLSMAVQTPTFGPNGGSYTEPQLVTLASSTPDVAIFYTTDGSTPTTSSALYLKPFVVTQTTTVRAIAIAAGLVTSKVSTATYSINTPDRPYRLNIGGAAAGAFAAGPTIPVIVEATTIPNPINTAVANAAPLTVYQSYLTPRYQPDMFFQLDHLDPGKSYVVRLHFAEPTYTTAGARKFDVWIQGALAYNDLDVVVRAGGVRRALVLDYTVQADLAGSIHLRLANGLGTQSGTAFLNGLEILDPLA